MISQADKDLPLPSGTLLASETAHNLGVIIDQQQTFDEHARACSRACYCHLRRIRQIRRFIDELHSSRLLVHAFITSRLDYCNGLFAKCSVVVRQRLQRIQNSAARLVCAEPAFSQVTSLLRRLHWLPVARRITYKLCVLMFDVFHGTAPEYLTRSVQSLQRPASPVINTRQFHCATDKDTICRQFVDCRRSSCLDLIAGPHQEHSVALGLLSSYKNLPVR